MAPTAYLDEEQLSQLARSADLVVVPGDDWVGGVCRAVDL